MSKTTQKPISYAGTFERSMDAKNRVTIPAAWLNGGPDEFHAIPHPSGDFLMVMPPEEFDSIETSIKQSGTRVARRESVTLVEKLAISIPPSFRRPGGPSAARSSQ